ncbi:MAG: serine/threonine protein kinase [Candidatus Obscuribacterales bacterium]|nr:serine/threonine protein kinase [Candidatus Obscuribacterales bacterium]
MIENLKTGTIVDERYSIAELLGVGGMGTVYLATESSVDRKVAIKFLQSGLIADEDSFSRFEREGRILSRLSHPGILTFYRFGLWNPEPGVSFPFIAMEYLQGTSLRSVLDEQQRLAPDRALNIVEQLCESLASAHNLNIVHRDLKPNNIMLIANTERDVIKVLDFGLAKFCRTPDAQSQHLTQTGNLVGSVHYMSPEQSTGRVVDARSDIYSAGCLLYELLTGAPPFNADSAVGILYMQANDHPILASEKVRDLPPGVDALIGKAMEKLPENRYQSMSLFLQAIRLVRAGGGEVLDPPTRKKLRRSRLAPFVLLALLLTVLGIYQMLDSRGYINPPDLRPARPVEVAPQPDASPISTASFAELARDVQRTERRFDQATRLGQDASGPAELLYLNLLRLVEYDLYHGREDDALALLSKMIRIALASGTD